MPTLVYPDLCPDCGYNLSRSRRRGLIERVIARLLRIAVFRCRRCGARFYSPPAVVVHARKRSPARVTEVSEDDFSQVVFAPGKPGPVAEVGVKVAKPVVSDKSPASQVWTQQAVGTSTDLWVGSTAQPRNNGRH